MARLISRPNGLAVRTATPLSGPRAVGGGGNTSIGNFMQTLASPFGAWRWQFTFPVSKNAAFRRYRGWVTALHGGANATRFPFFDPDMMSDAEAGLIATSAQRRLGMTWSNSMPWSNGQNWALSVPKVAVAEAAAKDASRIKLQVVFWGGKLQVGDYIGFFPLHFGLYMVTQEFGEGEYRIWPPLRKAIDTTGFATLSPVLAMRLESEESATADRGVAYAEEKTVVLVEVFDYDVRDYFDE
ncbi:hypothetical protein [Rhizobium mongolense]|uniref:Uncharacterized protein n=1 Tax=Rhizobium mongolense TaxID=57676 RepID=A0A7W6RSA9_9HYPH|nr:hypothetical protein [Rhizobium mongolense]MBB4277023.1 hypothetical protein [Rhizobium mongolense]